jgi:hypothetical protein
MSGWLKALFAVALIVVLLAVGVVVGGVVWWSRNKDKVVARLKGVATVGHEFGRNTDNQGCVDETVSRYKKEPGFEKKEPGFTSMLSNNIFTRTCLEASRPTPGFCRDVPKPTEFMKSGEWRTAQCRRVDLSSDSYCPLLFQPVQEFCERKARRSSNDNGNSNSQ